MGLGEGQLSCLVFADDFSFSHPGQSQATAQLSPVKAAEPEVDCHV